MSLSDFCTSNLANQQYRSGGRNLGLEECGPEDDHFAG